MYCTKCGKFIGTNSVFCNECNPNNVINYAPVQPQAPVWNQNEDYYQPPTVQQDTDTSAINLGKAIAAMILSFIGFIFMYAGILTIVLPAAAIVCMFIGLVPTILGLIFGIQSISNFKKTSYIKSGKKIPVMILGISSVIDSAIGLLFALVIVIFAAVLL